MKDISGDPPYAVRLKGKMRLKHKVVCVYYAFGFFHVIYKGYVISMWNPTEIEKCIFDYKINSIS